MSFVQPIVPYSRPFKRPLNYPDYKKNFDTNAHVQIFKVAIKANGETVNEKLINMFNFTLKDNAFD